MNYLNRYPQEIKKTRLTDSIDRLFNSAFDDFINFGLSPIRSKLNNFGRLNVSETPSEYILEMLMPGANKENIILDLNDHVLSVKYKNDQKNEVLEKNYTRQEWSYNEFEQHYELPENVNLEHIDANYENGILKIKLQKNEDEIKTSRRIELK